MLLRNESKVKLTVDINLYYDDETERHINVSEKDIIHLVYNNNGRRDVVEGKVKRIEIDKKPPAPVYRERDLYGIEPGYRPIKPPKEEAVRIVVDGSNLYSGKVARVYIKDIIDIEMIDKYDETLFIKTVPVGNGQINRIKIFDEKIFFSQDNGETYDYYIPLQKTSEIGKETTTSTDSGNSSGGDTNNDSTTNDDTSNNDTTP